VDLESGQSVTHELIPLRPIVRATVLDIAAEARRLNDQGGIVGFSEASTGGRHAFA